MRDQEGTARHRGGGAGCPGRGPGSWAGVSPLRVTHMRVQTQSHVVTDYTPTLTDTLQPGTALCTPACSQGPVLPSSPVSQPLTVPTVCQVPALQVAEWSAAPLGHLISHSLASPPAWPRARLPGQRDLPKSSVLPSVLSLTLQQASASPFLI